MRALQLTEWHHDAELRDVGEPDPGPGEVVVRIRGAGVCHSDLHLLYEFDAGLLPIEPPFTLGHENAGWVEALGAGVTGVEVGEPVAVYGSWGCGRCSRCRQGIENYCANPVEAAAAGGLGADVVLDIVGSEATMQLAVEVSRPLGDVTVVGIAGGSVPFGFFSVPYEVSLQTTYWGSSVELGEVLELARRGVVRAEVTTFSLDDATAAYDALRSGSLHGRAVVVP